AFEALGARLAGDGARGIPGGFAPRAGDRAAAIGSVARQVEIIALACTTQVETHLGAAAGDIIGRAAAQPLLHAVACAQRAAARPSAGERSERRDRGGRGA